MDALNLSQTWMVLVDQAELWFAILSLGLVTRRLVRRLLRSGNRIVRLCAMCETAIDLRALFNGQGFILHITVNLRATEHDQFAGADRAIDLASQARGFGHDSAGDLARFALNQRRAFDVAFDRTIDMQVCRCFDITFDSDV